MPDTSAISKSFKVRPGDRWDGVSRTIERSGVDWDLAEVSVVLRRSPQGAVVKTIEPTLDPGTDQITISFYLSGTDTANLRLGNTYYGEVIVTVPATVPGDEPDFGPYTVFVWTLEMTNIPEVESVDGLTVHLASGNVGGGGSDGQDGAGFQLGDPIYIHPDSRNMYAYISGTYYPLTWTLVDGTPALTASDAGTATPT